MRNWTLERAVVLLIFVVIVIALVIFLFSLADRA